MKYLTARAQYRNTGVTYIIELHSRDSSVVPKKRLKTKVFTEELLCVCSLSFKKAAMTQYDITHF